MKSLLTLLLSSILLNLNAQNSHMTGTWQGVLRDEFLQVNIVEGNGRLCGYTWDYVYSNKSSTCKAYFTATYDPYSKYWNFSGVSFIETSGDHLLMNMHFKLSDNKKTTILTGYAGEQSTGFSFLSDPMMDYVELKRVNKKPAHIYPFMQDCISESKRKPLKKLPIIKPVTSKKPIPKQIPPSRVDMPPPQKKDTVNDNRIKPVQPLAGKKDNESAALTKMTARKRTEAARIEIHERHIELKVYDNGVVDGDSVSIFYNGRLIVSKKRLTEEPITIPLDLDENTNIHEITMFAENLGSIPPNTALIIVTAGDKRYELRSSATLSTNSVLVFEYKPSK